MIFLFSRFIGNKRFPPSQSGFLPGDSCIAQLLAIVYEIQTNLDSNPPADVRGVFLDISKGFDKIWHKGLLFKLKSYLSNGEQRVVLNGQTFDWRKINSGVPQGSVLCPLLFLIYINDPPGGITSNY